MARADPTDADATLDTDAATLRRLVFGGVELARARRAGDVTVSGDEALAARVLALFRRPTPAAG